MHVNGLKLNGPLTKPWKSDRAVGDVNIGDLPLRDLFETSGKIEQFADVNLNVALDPRETFWDNVIYKLCALSATLTVPCLGSARARSAQFDQGNGRHACNNPYNVALEDDMLENAPKAGKINCIAHKDFLDLIAPSFSGVEDTEDSAAILARTHLIVLTLKGVYWRLAGTGKEEVPFTLWPENESKDLLVAAQKPIFKAYKKDPAAHTLPSNFHEDCVWSQELLRKMLSGEDVSRTITIRGMSLFGSGSSERHKVPRLLPRAEMQTRVKQEQVNQVFRNLKRQLIDTVINLDSPSSVKRHCSASSRTPDSLPGMEVETDGFPAPGERDDLEVALEAEMESMMATEE